MPRKTSTIFTSASKDSSDSTSNNNSSRRGNIGKDQGGVLEGREEELENGEGAVPFEAEAATSTAATLITDKKQAASEECAASKVQHKKQQHQKKKKQRENTPMEVDKLLPPRAASLKRSREEEEEELAQRHSGRSRAERVMNKSRSLSVPASPREDEEYIVKAMSLSASPARVPPPPILP